MQPSILRNVLLASLAFGLATGLVFPFFADLFVTWKPGMRGWFAAAALAAGATVGAANYWLVNRILIARLRRIAEVANAIGGGDLTHRCSMQSADTIGEIIAAFNTMAATLRDLIGELSTLSAQVDGGTHAIEARVGDIRNRFTAQRDDAGQIVDALAAMRAKGDEIAQTATQVAASTDHAVELAQGGASVVAETIVSMGDIERTVTSASNDIFQLGQRSDEIGTIIAVIRGIAEQTNLLALNAAIEAARAGEQGRGFAVVADEVRKLAEKTGSATEEISQMIGTIQNQVRQTVVTMEASRGNVQSGVARAEKAGQSLAEILDSIRSVSAMMARIAALSGEQQSLAGDTVGRAEGIAASIGETLGETASCDQSCLDLAARTSQLHEQVARFRIA